MPLNIEPEDFLTGLSQWMGGLFFVGLLIGVPSSLLNRRVVRPFIATMLVVALIGHISQLSVDVDLSPDFSPHELPGIWLDGEKRLEIYGDKTCIPRTGEARVGWTIEGCSLVASKHRWQVVRANGKIRLIEDFPGDPDGWNGALGFHKAN